MSSPIRSWVAAGVVAFVGNAAFRPAVAAAVSVLLGTCTECNDSTDYLWVPVAGPMIFAARNNGAGSSGAYILWSATQAAGIIMFIAGEVGHDVMEYRVARGGPTLQLAP